MAPMNPAAAGGVQYRVPPEPSPMSSALLALIVHAGLLLFLWIGISWQSTPPTAVEAEVWDMKTEQAAPIAQRQPEPEPKPEPEPEVKTPPKPVEEPPQVKAPDINLERIKEQKRLEKEKLLAAEKEKKELEKEKKARELEEKVAKEKADKAAKAAQALADAKIAKIREAEMKRLMSQAGGTGTAAQSSATRIDTGYAAAVSGKIKRSTSYVGDTDLPGNPEVRFKIDQLPTGEIISVRKIKSSGVPAFDEAVERGINNSSPLPKKKDGTVDRSVDVTIKMKDVD